MTYFSRVGKAFLLAGVWIVIGNCAPVDEAYKKGFKAENFPEADIDFFNGMDGGGSLNSDELKGRNSWMLWTAGNEAFWNWMSQNSFGMVDLLKIIDSRTRDNRFENYGIINEPYTRKASKPDKYGLWLDEAAAADAGIDSNIYGRSSGVVGLRLYPNPEFTAEAEKRWDPHRFYNDPEFHNDPGLIRPYRVGMACAFCHVAPHPLRPPMNVEAPQWENLSANIGNQYFRAGRVFGSLLEPDSFVKQLMDSNPPGTLDTSLLATDYNNNPRTINAIFAVSARLSVAANEIVDGDALNLLGTQHAMKVPHILKDGSDSVGILGALTRVYISIGEFHEEWIKHHKLLIGIQKQTPFPVKKARQNSVYWQATAARVGNVAKYLLKVATPMDLKQAKGSSYIDADKASRGAVLFGRECAGCHSSKQPPPPTKYGTPGYTEWHVLEAQKPDYHKDNYFSTDERIPVTKVKTNACAALATNATRGHIWESFSSETYKSLPSVGTLDVEYPTGPTDSPLYQQSKFQAPGGGPGYYRVPSLLSLWATAPYLHNNSLGGYSSDVSVEGRLRAFNDGIRELLWPERRGRQVYKTKGETYLELHDSYIPPLTRIILKWKGLIDEDRIFRLGPIPHDTPINLLANINFDLRDGETRKDIFDILVDLKKTLKRIRKERLTADKSGEVLNGLVTQLLSVSKCPDFVVNRGHEFGKELTDANKYDLIEFLKTL